MRCPRCNFQNPSPANFCANCGTILTPPTSDRWQSLRGFVPPDVAQRIMAAGGLGEPRTVTAMFCDVAGSTSLGERLGPERFKVVMDQVLGRMVTAVARYEGTVAQVMGDGLLTFFGAPLAHEDDAERAVQAALDVRDDLVAFAHDLEIAYGVSLQVRIGLNTGPVALSRVVDVLEVAYNALGDTVTTAARLQSVAAPGAILASETTGRLVAALFESRSLGPLTLKGKSSTVTAVEILRRRGLVGKARGIIGLTAPLVGRDRELAQLQASVEAVTEGRGQIVAIIGEAGIGKSRLVAEVQHLSPQIRWLEGRCLSYAGAIPYVPFLDLLREWLGVTAADPEPKIRIELHAAVNQLFGEEAALVYPYLGSMLRLSLEPELAARIGDLSAESLQHQTFQVLRQWASSLAAKQPLAVILDDLHWADGTSLALLEAVLDVTEAAPLLICTLFRPEREHGCWRVNDLARQRFPHRHSEIVLGPLAPESSDALVNHLLVLPDFPKEVRDVILGKAEGNPFFVEEIIRALIDAGTLVRDGDRWRAARLVSALDIPNSVQGVLLSRIDRLPETVRRVLQAASVIGRLFPFEILKRTIEEDGAVDAALVELQRHDLIVERRRIPQVEYRFKHALTQEVAYSTLGTGERQRLHRAVAQAVEAHYGMRLEEVFGLLAYHYDQAADEDRALHFLVRAGDMSRAEYADEEALRYYARAVALLKKRGEVEAAAQTLMKAALAYHLACDFRAANQAFQEAAQLFAQMPRSMRLPLPPATLRVALPEPKEVDSARNTDIFSGFVANHIFEGLLRSAPDSNVAPGVARSWEISDDGCRYRFHLHRDRRWSDGRPVTAHDFVFSWLRAMRGIRAAAFYDIVGTREYTDGKTDDPRSVGIRALDDFTLEVILEGPSAFIPQAFAHFVMLPHPRWVIERYGDDWTDPEHLVANGPYKIRTWRPGHDLTLTANSSYAGVRRGNVSDVLLIFDEGHDAMLFEQKVVDAQMLLMLDEATATRIRDDLILGPYERTKCIAFLCDRPPFNDRRVRLAFAYATDRLALARAGGFNSILADGGFVPPSVPGHSPYIGVPFDPERARELLREAGYPNGEGLGPFNVPTTPAVDSGAEIPTRAWQEILGVQATVTRRRFVGITDWLEMMPGPIVHTGWAAGTAPDYLRLVFHSSSRYNVGRWKNARFDGLVDEAQASTDLRRRMALYHEADRILVAEEAAIIPTAYSRRMTAARPHVKGWIQTIADLVVEPAR